MRLVFVRELGAFFLWEMRRYIMANEGIGGLWSVIALRGLCIDISFGKP